MLKLVSHPLKIISAREDVLILIQMVRLLPKQECASVTLHNDKGRFIYEYS